jgi:signal transduction histidine kinase
MLHVTGARHVLRREPEAAEEALRLAEGMGRRSLDELRRTLALLRSEDEDGLRPPLPSVAEIGSLVEQARSGGLAVELRTSGDLAGVPSGVGVAVYRIAQEALANAAKHAPHARTVVSLEVVARQVCLVADTTGPIRGAEVDGRRAHYGLVGMRERATALGGEFGAGPTADGWHVKCRIPLRLGDDRDEGGAPIP